MIGHPESDVLLDEEIQSTPELPLELKNLLVCLALSSSKKVCYKEESVLCVKLASEVESPSDPRFGWPIILRPGCLKRLIDLRHLERHGSEFLHLTDLGQEEGERIIAVFI